MRRKGNCWGNNKTSAMGYNLRWLLRAIPRLGMGQFKQAL